MVKDMEFRNIFKGIFNSPKKNLNYSTKIQMINGYTPNYFFSTKATVYENDVARECIDTIASHVAKLRPRHVRDNKHVVGDIDRLLSSRPNRYMNSYDFLYKIVSILYTDNVVFVYINIENDNIEGFYPINATSYEVLEDENKNYYLRFNYDNKLIVVEFDKLITLRRFYNTSDVYGDSNETLKNSLETQATTVQGIKNAIKLSNSIKGLLKIGNLTLNPEDLKHYRDQFVENYINLENGSGIVSLDARADYQEINVKPFSLSSEEMKEVNNNIYRYFRISEDIIKSIYNEESWNSFYRSVIETIAVQLSIEFTNKIFSDRAIKLGHKIKFFTNTLDYTNLETKIKMIKEIAPLGVLSKNEIRETLGFPALENPEEGQKLLQSLNYVDSEYAEEYQLKAIKDKAEKEMEKEKEDKDKISEEKENIDGNKEI